MINNPIFFKKDRSYSSFLCRAYPEIFGTNGVPMNSSSNKCKTITFQVTNDCNLRCSYCYEINKKQEYMTFDTAKKFIDKLLNNCYSNYHIDPEQSPGIIFDFIGGEPLLNIKLITQICDYFEERLIELNHPWLLFHRYSISSNGTLYFTKDVQNFLQRYKHLVSFNITVDGNKELHDACRLFPNGAPSYDLAHTAALDWKNITGEAGSKITLSPQNIHLTAQAIIDFINDDFTEIFANCVFEEGWDNSHATILYNELKKITDYLIDNNLINNYYISLFEFRNFQPMLPEDNTNWCGGDGQMLAVDPNGELFPCIRYMESSLGNEQSALRIGHVDTYIGDTLIHQQVLKSLSDITRRSQSTDECFYCPIAKGCAWCSGYNYQKFGTPNKRAIYICCMHKARALANVYYWNKFFEINNMPLYMPMNCPKDWALEIISEDEYNFLLTFTQKEDHINVVDFRSQSY